MDKPPYASNERTDDYWPKVCAGNLYWDEGPPPDLHLHTDGYRQGELNCWIAPMPCEWFTWQGAKLRIRDDVNNWRHSDDLSPGENPDVQIDCPTETIEWGHQSVTINAEIVGNSLYNPIIKWSVQKSVGGAWVDYGPHEDALHQYCDSGYYSTISQDIDNWTGPEFVIGIFQDCKMRVCARIEVCGERLDDICDLVDDSPIELEVEPGPYWIDGPSIPAFPGTEPGWHDASLQAVEVSAWLQCACCGNIQHRMEPVPFYEDSDCEGVYYEGLRVGQVQIKICVDEQQCSCFDFLSIAFYDSDENPITDLCIECEVDEYCEEPLIWNLQEPELECGTYKAVVAGMVKQYGGWYAGIYTEETQLEITRVTQEDVVAIAEIYQGDRWIAGYKRCPHNPEPDGGIDCCGFVTQLLRRLSRRDASGAYPHDHRCATCWQSAWCVEPISWSELKMGDIISWDPKPGHEMGHVVIFVGWNDPDKQEYGLDDYYMCWDSALGVTVGEHSYAASSRMHPLRWSSTVSNPVFNPCP